MAVDRSFHHRPPEVRRAEGREARKALPRRVHGRWTPPADRPDPVALLTAQDADRQPDLVPIRWGRMSASPFAFYRGSASLMAADLAPLPRTGLQVQLCGDAHLSNFGVYASPERALLFGVNDFDETSPGPFEWDLKRLTTSFVLAARNNGFAEEAARAAAVAAVRSYRKHMAEYAGMRELDVWYSRVVAEDLLELTRAHSRFAAKTAQKTVAKARSRGSLRAAGRLTESVDGRQRFVERPPLIVHPDELAETDTIHHLFHQYTRTLVDDRRELAQRFDVIDVARKVVGVGSVGTRCHVVLLEGRDDNDPLILQFKEAGPSVLEPYLGKSAFAHAGHRVVAGQRLMQAASDIFLGWMTGPAGRHYYWRQLHDMKGSLEVETLSPAGLELYAEACGWTLARGHARSGRRIAIAAYLGVGDRFDQAVADFAAAYANQAEKDFAAVSKAIKQGQITAESGV